MTHFINIEDVSNVFFFLLIPTKLAFVVRLRLRKCWLSRNKKTYHHACIPRRVRQRCRYHCTPTVRRYVLGPM